MSFYIEPLKKEISSLSLEQIAQMIDGSIIQNGPSDLLITGIGSPGRAKKSEIVFILEKVSLERAIMQNPGALVIEKGKNLQGREIPLIEVSDVRIARILMLKYFSMNRNVKDLGIHPSASISPGSVIGNNVTIMPNVVIMDGVQIGSHVVLYPNVTLEYDCHIGDGTILYPGVVIGERCIIGKKNIIYSGAVIGTDGFGYYDKDNIRYKIPQIGIVETEDLVEIGANVCIDRATIHRTIIARETKIDNLVQIGHNCHIGQKCYIVSQVGISGSSNIGNEVILGGQVGIADHINIGDRVMVLAKSGVPEDIAAGEKVFGIPARPVRTSHKINGALPYLPELLKRVTELEKKIAAHDNFSQDS